MTYKVSGFNPGNSNPYCLFFYLSRLQKELQELKIDKRNPLLFYLDIPSIKTLLLNKAKEIRIFKMINCLN